MGKVFVVCGSSGSRSNEDNSSWNVKAFTDVNAATVYAARLDRRSERLCKAKEAFDYRFGGDSFEYKETKYFTRFGDPKPDRLDPCRIWAWERPEYHVEELDLIGGW